MALTIIRSPGLAMAVYLFTFHGYRTWRPDNPRGFVQKGPGVREPSAATARFYDSQSASKPTTFGRRHQEILIWMLHDACRRRQWRLHFVATESTHVHILVSWRSYTRWEEVSVRLKNLMSFALGRKLQERGRKWFSRKGSRKRVQDKEHFDYLMERYLPSHRGLSWHEGDAPPVEPGVGTES